jgi:sugar lactone lactonase YvrE
VRWYGDTGLCLDEFGSEGTVTGAFHEPSGLALAADGSLAVADTWNGRVQLLRADGTVEAIGNGLFGPRGLLWMPDGSLLVADTGNRRLLRFAPPEWGLEVVAQLPAPVVGLAWAGGLVAAAIPADGAIVLIEVPEGRIVRRLEIPGWSSREQQEGHLALLPSGDLLASAPQPGELWIADPTGATAPRLFRADLPGITAIAIRPDGDLLASLTWEHRLVSIDLEE